MSLNMTVSQPPVHHAESVEMVESVLPSPQCESLSELQFDLPEILRTGRDSLFLKDVLMAGKSTIVYPTFMQNASSSAWNVPSPACHTFEGAAIPIWSIVGAMIKLRHRRHGLIGGCTGSIEAQEELIKQRRSQHMSVMSEGWELSLINGLQHDDTDHEQLIKHLEKLQRNSVIFEENITPESNERISDPSHRFSDNDSVFHAAMSTPLPPSLLEIFHVQNAHSLQIMHATQVLKDLQSCSESAKEYSCSEEMSPISPISSDNSFKTALYAEDWPLPANTSYPTIITPTCRLPDPLRCNPPDRVLRQVPSQCSMKSTKSDKSQRKAFIMQRKDSSGISFHTQGTTHDISDLPLVIEEESELSVRKIPSQVFGLKRANAVRKKPSLFRFLVTKYS